jgi:CheY-like chemotaxis protein
MLSRAGVRHPVVPIDGGEEAIAYLRACLTPGAGGLKPAAIFSDIKMPKLDGFAVLEWVQKHTALRATPFFILCGGGVPEDQERARELGATDYLVKFPSGDELKRILAAVGLL